MILLALSILFANLTLAFQESDCHCVISPQDQLIHGKIQNLFDNCRVIEFQEGNYDIQEPININSDIDIIGNGANVYFYAGNNYKRNKPKGLFLLKTDINFSLNNLVVWGDKGYAVVHTFNPKKKYFRKVNISLIENKINGVGLIWSCPSQGFTFNLPSKGLDYIYSGDIKWALSNVELYISKNIIRGAVIKSRKEANLAGSAIALLYVSNGTIINNSISNYRFGVWLYGGGTIKTYTSEPPKRIMTDYYVASNKIENTYCSIFLSSVDRAVVSKNKSDNTFDVSIDFEGCNNILVSDNISLNANGGSFTVLNNSENVWIINNRSENNFSLLNSRKFVGLIRNSKNNINYHNNIFRYNGPPFKAVFKVEMDPGITPNYSFEKNTMVNCELINKDFHIKRK